MIETLAAVWIGVGLMWGWNGWKYRALLKLQEESTLAKAALDREMIAIMRAQLERRGVLLTPPAEARH